MVATLMVVDALMMLASWHPLHEDEYNGFNPGLILSAGVRVNDAETYICAGAYLDSYSHWASVAGAGIRMPVTKKFGLDVALAHINGSAVDKAPVMVVPSLYYKEDKWALQAIFTPSVIAFGVSYRLWK